MTWTTLSHALGIGTFGGCSYEENMDIIVHKYQKYVQVGQPVKHELLPVELALAFSLLAIPIAKIAIILLTPIIFLDFFLKKDVLVIIYSLPPNKNVMLPNRTT